MREEGFFFSIIPYKNFNNEDFYQTLKWSFNVSCYMMSKWERDFAVYCLDFEFFILVRLLTVTFLIALRSWTIV